MWDAARDWIGRRSWTYVEADTYVEVWETVDDDRLYIRDRLQETTQSTFDDFQTPRYVVGLDRWYRPSDEPEVLDTFWEEDEAAGIIRVLTY